jgi:hypothetical protein
MENGKKVYVVATKNDRGETINVKNLKPKF